MSEIVRIPFHGDELLTVEVDGKPHIVLKPAIEAIGLQYWSQIEKLHRRSWATTSQKEVVAADGKVRDMLTGDIRTFLMLLATIDERRVAERVRPKLIAYQSEVADVIESYWTRGHAINPRTAETDEPFTYTWDEVTVLLRQRYGIAVSVAALRAKLRTAGVLRQTFEPRTAHRHFFWLTAPGTWEIHPHAIAFLARKYEDIDKEMREFRFIQMRLELDGLASPALTP